MSLLTPQLPLGKPRHDTVWLLFFKLHQYGLLVTLKAKWMEITGVCLLSPCPCLQPSWWWWLPGQPAHPPRTRSHQRHRCRSALLQLAARPRVAPPSCVCTIFQPLGLPCTGVKSLLLFRGGEGSIWSSVRLVFYICTWVHLK